MRILLAQMQWLRRQGHHVTAAYRARATAATTATAALPAWASPEAADCQVVLGPSEQLHVGLQAAGVLAGLDVAVVVRRLLLLACQQAARALQEPARLLGGSLH